MVEGIGRDKISDFTTNIIRRKFAILYEGPMRVARDAGLARSRCTPSYDPQLHQWRSEYFLLPVADGRPLV